MSLTDEEHTKIANRLTEIGFKACKTCGTDGPEALGITESNIQSDQLRVRCALVFCVTCGQTSMFLLHRLLRDRTSEEVV